MNKIISLLFASAFVMFSNIAFGQVIFFEDFESDGIPQNFTLIDNDGNTPAANVSYFTNAWIARNAPGSTDSVAASTSWYTPADTSDDWMITPAIATGTNVILTWNAKAQDAAYRDGYNVLVSRTGITIPDFTDTIFSVAMEDSNWITRSVDLSAKGYDNSTIYIAFQNNSVDMYMLMIDDIKVRNIPSTDIEIGVVTLPGSSCTLTAAESISIEIKNTGLNAVSNIPVGYIVNGGSAVVETFSGTLQPGSDTIYTFTQTADFSTSGSQYDVRAFVAASGDGDVANDSSFSSTVYNVSPSDIDNASYATSFETLNEILGWSTDDVNGDGRGWFLAGTQAYDGINAYLCLYNASLAANDWLYSTCFDLSGNTAYKLNFFYKTGSSASNTYPEKFAVYYGTAKNAASMTQIEDIGEVSNIDYEESTLTFKPAASGTYYIGFKCYSDADMYYLAIDQITVDKLSPPVASFTYTTVNLGVSFNTPNGNDPANTLSWNYGDGNVEAGSGSGAVHTYAQEGTYNVCLTVNNIAGSDTYCDSVSVIAAGIATVSNSNLVKIFPNPTTGNINLTFSNAQPTHVTVTNALGIVVSEESINNAVKNYALQLHDAANGIYFVKVVQGNETDVKKISLSK